MDFIDTDLLIQGRMGTLLQDIIRDRGIGGFIHIENEIITGINCLNTVIATGGSAVYSHEAMGHLGSRGIIVYLEVGYNEIVRRITNITSRGIVFEEGEELIDLYDRRLPLYERYADLTIHCNHRDIESIVSQIKEDVKGL